jgi:hypothetical protein
MLPSVYLLGKPASLLVVANTHPLLSLVCQQLPHPLLVLPPFHTPQIKLQYLHRRHQQHQSSLSGTVIIMIYRRGRETRCTAYLPYLTTPWHISLMYRCVLNVVVYVLLHRLCILKTLAARPRRSELRLFLLTPGIPGNLTVTPRGWAAILLTFPSAINIFLIVSCYAAPSLRTSLAKFSA